MSAPLSTASSFRRGLAFGAGLLMAAIPAVLLAAQVAPLKAFSNGTVADANDINANFSALHTELNAHDLRFDVVRVPAGAVSAFVSATCPSGWVKANGASLTTATYPALAAALGAGGTTFTVPDLRGEFVRGWDDARTVDNGRAIRSTQVQDFKSFSARNGDGGSPYNHEWNYVPKDGNVSGPVFGGYWAAPGGNLRFAWDGSEVRPRNVALLYCIKT